MSLLLQCKRQLQLLFTLRCKGDCQNTPTCKCISMFSELHEYNAATADDVGACAVQMANKIATKKLPTASITLLGSGTMHWSKDKQIDVMQGTVHFLYVCRQLALSITSPSHFPPHASCCPSFAHSCMHCKIDTLCSMHHGAPQCNA